MTPKTETQVKSKTNSRLRMEIVEAMQGLHRCGIVSDADLTKTTLRMLGKKALPKIGAMSPAEISALRASCGLSQAVLAAYMNIAVNTVSQWERGERQPTGSALKLLHVVKQHGVAALA